jgi:deoxyribose-phosphate aldolase
MFSKTGLAKLIDVAMLRGDATTDDIKKLCAQARSYHFAAVTVFPYWVHRTVQELRGSDVKVCTAIGLPFGAYAISHKIAGVKQAVHDGAHTIEVVINLGELLSGNTDYIRREVNEVISAAKMRSLTEDGSDVTVMITAETAWTNRDQQRSICKIVNEAGGDFITTNTGFASRGVSIEDVLSLREMADYDLGIKAAGGIRSLEQARNLLNAGANRLGTSAGVLLVENFEGEL